MKLIITLILLMSLLCSCGQTAKEYFDSGVTKSKVKDYLEAIQDFTKAIELNPNYKEAYALRGSCKFDLGDKKGGCLDFSKAGELGDQFAYDLIKKHCN